MPLHNYLKRSLPLAMAHGILAQLFFSTLVALATFTSTRWRGDETPTLRPGVRGERLLGAVLVGSIAVQLVLGAAQRHFQALLLLHILSGLAIVAPLALHVGFKSWALNDHSKLLKRMGLALVALVGFQVLLGFGAYLATRGAAAGTMPMAADLWLATLHQWTGAVLLATAVSLHCWSHRLLGPLTLDPQTAP